MKKILNFSLPRLGAAALFAAIAFAQDVPVTVQLTTPISAGVVHKGDRITMQIASPDSLKNDTVLCTVTNVSSSKKQTAVEFTVDSLHHSSGVDVPVSADVQGVANSKGQPGIDDNGRAVHASFVQARSASHTGLSSRLGGAIGGRLGNAVSQA